MKRRLQQFICALAVLCLVAGFAPVQAQAYEKKGEYRIHTVSQNKWVTDAKETGDYINVYKIKVPAEGYIRVFMNDSHLTEHIHGNHMPDIALYDSYKIADENVYMTCAFRDETNWLAVKKGTYYLSPRYAGTKFRWNFQKKSSGSNYCMAKAETVKNGKNSVLYYGYGYEFSKWYKVKLTKKQKIKAFARPMECKLGKRRRRDPGPGLAMVIVDSKYKKVATSHVANYTEMTGLLNKGTYYIRLERLPEEPGTDEGYATRLISFTCKWQ